MENENDTILAIDVGNSSIHWNYINNTKVEDYKRNKHTELSLLPWDEVKEKNIPVVIAGALPHINEAAKTIAEDYKIKLLEITINNQKIIKNTYPTLGIDRICNLIGGLNSFSKLDTPLVIVDFGSATTVTSCDNKGNFLGGIIRTGFDVELKAISSKTLSLPHVELAKEQKIKRLNPLAKNTEDAILNGVIIGQIALLEEYLKLFKKETSTNPKVIITGGNSSIIARLWEHNDFTFDPMITL